MQLGESGVNAFSVKKFAGHSDIKTTLGYIHASETKMAQEVLGSPMTAVENVPKKQTSPDLESMRLALKVRLAKGEIGEEAWSRAMRAFEPTPSIIAI